MGGMAEVFRARSVGRDGFTKELCIKRILPQFCTEDDFVRMFIDEATLVARLQHANIVQIFDFDQVDGSYYIAMEYVHGKDLRSVIKLGSQHNMPLGPLRAAIIGVEMCKGLHYAHNKDTLGLVHRDVSPHNVLVSTTGEVKVMDFGIAKAADRITRTSTGIIKGKIAYMAPEQAAGAELDHRVDQFATALVLFEMLTGRRAYEGTEAVSLRRALNGEVEPPSTADPEVPPEMDEVFIRATHRNPADRYPDMRAMERALTAYVYKNGPPDEALDMGVYMRALMAKAAPRARTAVMVERAELRGPNASQPSGIQVDPALMTVTPSAIMPLNADEAADSPEVDDKTASQPSYPAVTPSGDPQQAQDRNPATPVPGPASRYAPTTLDMPAASDPAPLSGEATVREGSIPSIVSQPAATAAAATAPLVPPTAPQRPSALPAIGTAPPASGAVPLQPPAQAPLHSGEQTLPSGDQDTRSATSPVTVRARGNGMWVLVGAVSTILVGGSAALLVRGAQGTFGATSQAQPAAPQAQPSGQAAEPLAPAQHLTPAAASAAPAPASPAEEQTPAPDKADPEPESASPRRTRPEARAARKAKVKVVITSGASWAQVFIRGREVLAETPGEILLEPGRHVLTFKNPEMSKHQNVVVTIKAGAGPIRVVNPLK